MNLVGPAGCTGCSWLSNVGMGKKPNDVALTFGKSFSTAAAVDSGETVIAYFPPASAESVSAKASDIAFLPKQPAWYRSLICVMALVMFWSPANVAWFALSLSESPGSACSKDGPTIGNHRTWCQPSEIGSKIGVIPFAWIVVHAALNSSNVLGTAMPRSEKICLL